MTEQAIQHIKQIQESTGFIEDIIYNNLVSFKDHFMNHIPYATITNVVFDSDCVTIESVHLEFGLVYVYYKDLVEWINSI